jgi:hypothetical protein
MLQNPLRLLAVVFGAVYVVVGVLGFAVTGIGSLLGSVGILAVSNVDSARSAAQVFGLVYVMLSILGFLEVGAALNALALNMADNFLHLLSGGTALLIGLLVRREVIFGKRRDASLTP